MKTQAKIRRDIRAAWIEKLFLTGAADRPRAQAAATALYAALKLPAPRNFLWFDSPRDAAWTAAVLLAPEYEHWREKLRQDERTAALRPTIEGIREHLRLTLAGPAGASLQEHLGGKRIFPARLSLYPDIQTLWRRSAFTDEDDLHRAERYFRAVIFAGLPNAWQATAALPMSIMAADDAQAAGNRVPPLLAAMWDLARTCGPWWAFEHAAILTDRPSEIHRNERQLLHRTDGPAVVYRDGWQVYAVDGQVVEPPAPQATRRPRPCGAHHLERYLAGEHREVWEELIALGPAVREAPYAAAAKQVAQETMRRVAVNVRTVVQRLESLDYAFNGTPHLPPGSHTPGQLQELDELAGPLPLSLQAFYEIVGAVDLTGFHETIAPGQNGYFRPDPLVVFPPSASLLEYGEASESNYGLISLAPDSFHKADFSGGAPYEMKLPEPRADGEFLNEPHGLFFVDYLRVAFRHGGFPGYDGIDRDLPEELALLTRGLEPF